VDAPKTRVKARLPQFQRITAIIFRGRPASVHACTREQSLWAHMPFACSAMLVHSQFPARRVCSEKGTGRPERAADASRFSINHVTFGRCVMYPVRYGRKWIVRKGRSRPLFFFCLQKVWACRKIDLKRDGTRDYYEDLSNRSRAYFDEKWSMIGHNCYKISQARYLIMLDWSVHDKKYIIFLAN